MGFKAWALRHGFAGQFGRPGAGDFVAEPRRKFFLCGDALAAKGKEHPSLRIWRARRFEKFAEIRCFGGCWRDTARLRQAVLKAYAEV
jgi:hypothetical protein